MALTGPTDPLGWAKKPRSRIAIERIQSLATKDRRLASIWQKLVADGVATEDGQALRLWDGTRWCGNGH